MPSIIRCWPTGHNNCPFHGQYGTPPEHHPKVKTQAHITFDATEIIKCIWYGNYSKKLSDHEILIGLTY